MLVNVSAAVLAIGAVALCVLGFRQPRHAADNYWASAAAVAVVLALISHAPWWAVGIDLFAMAVILRNKRVRRANEARRESN